MTPSSLCRSYRTLLPHHRHDGCLYRCRRHVDGTFKAVRRCTAFSHDEDVLEQFKNGQNNIIDVAEARRFGFLRVMQTAGPVDRDIGQFLVQLHRASQRATS